MAGGVSYREEPCRSALNRVTGMRFAWSLNPYMGCAHRCTFCYVRAFERRADRPSDDRYGTSVRVKVNVVEVLRAELARRSWRHESVAIGAATDPYQPAEGHYRLTRGCIEVLDMLNGTPGWPEPALWRGAVLALETSDDVPPPRQVGYWLRNLAAQGILAGYPLSRDYPDREPCLLIAVTEQRTREEIDRLVAALAAA